MPGSNSVKYNFRNVKQFKADLQKFKRESTQEGKLRKALQPVADRLLREAQKRVPDRTGALKASLVVVPKIDVRYPKVGLILGHTGPRIRIAHLVEYGTRHSKAKPYMRPALNRIKRIAPRMLTDEFRKIMQASARATRTLKIVR